MEIKGSIVLITGANGGIGRELVRAFLQSGAARIYAGVRRAEDVSEAVKDARVRPVVLDIADPAQVAAAAKQCSDVTILVNNAGISTHRSLISAPTVDGAKEGMNVNFFGTLSMCRAFAPVLRHNGGGCIVNVLSMLAWVNLPAFGSYYASKAALWSLTQAARAELAGQGTRVIAVLPGTIDTPFSAASQRTKAHPSVVADGTIKAILGQDEEVFPDPEAVWVAKELRADPKAVEKQLAAYLPQ